MLWLNQYTTNDVARGLAQAGLGMVSSGAVYALSQSHVGALSGYLFSRPDGRRPVVAGEGEKRSGRKLQFAPWEMGWVDRAVLLVFGVTYKAMRGLFVNSLRLEGGKETVELPKLDVTCPVSISGRHVQLYERAIALKKERTSNKSGKGMADQFLLAAMTNQLMLLLVVHPGLPVSPLGGVNVRNRVEFFSSSDDDLREMTAYATVGGKDNLARVVKRGIEFDILVDVRSARNANKLVLRQIITILAPCKTDLSTTKATTTASEEEDDLEYSAIGQVEMTSSAPGLWCRVCGDYNPIHVSSLLAKLFGFPGKIAHGNHVVAKTLELMDYAEKGGRGEGKDWWVEMQFRRPMVLPIRLGVEVREGESNNGVRWQCVGKQGKVHVSGTVGQM
ncbi:MaoC-like domain-containing protein [Pseudozyma hubeiensis]|nr:MaoC-like domain-containing protein [Pseudozyma hubeiensis]